MSTRGVYGLFKNGVDKVTYNHSDSYPSGLGNDIFNFIKETSIEELNKIFDKIILVQENDVPTIEQIINCQEYTDLTVSNQNITDFYCLLRKTQGNLGVYKGNLKYMIDYKDFVGNGLNCEYAYIINLDENTLEFYIGKKNIPTNNRFTKYRDLKNNMDYPECTLVAKIPLERIKEGTYTIDNLENLETEEE